MRYYAADYRKYARNALAGNGEPRSVWRWLRRCWAAVMEFPVAVGSV